MDLDTLKALAPYADLAKEVYGDGLKPGVQQVGKAIGTVLGLGNTVLLPLQLANERSSFWIRAHLESYRKKLESIPADNITNVPPEIGVPIMEKLTYVSNEQLSEMYINLLAQASTLSGNENAHPSFVNILNNLCPDEALIIGALDVQTFPYHEVRLRGEGAKFISCNDFLIDTDRVKLTHPHNLPAYMQNLAGLGIVKMLNNVWMDYNLSYYETREEKWLPEFAKGYGADSSKIDFIRHSIKTTDLGHMLYRACILPPRN